MENLNRSSRVKAALETVGTAANELKIISVELLSSLDTQVAYEKFRRWKSRAQQRIQEKVSETEAENFKNVLEPVIRGEDPLKSLTLIIQNHTAFLLALYSEIDDHPEMLERQRASETAAKGFSRALSHLERNHSPENLQISTTEFMPKNPTKVFIVHGHDEGNLFRVRDILKDRFNLHPIVLRAEAGKGRTIIEKFEEEAKDAAFAFVLLTPDDLIKTTTREYTQARPNVIFELGWFYGRLGRKNVCILFKKGTQIHSDLEGVERIEFRDHVDEAYLAIERELKSGGII